MKDSEQNKFNIGDLVSFDCSADFPKSEYPGVYKIEHGVGVVARVVDDYQVNWDRLAGEQTYDRVVEYDIIWSAKGTTRTYERYLKVVSRAG